MMRPLAGSVVIAYLASLAVLEATAVVVFRTPLVIVIAADSAEQTLDARGDVVSRSRTCKIHRGGRWWLASSGVTVLSPAVDVPIAAARAIAHTDTIDEAHAAISRAIFPRLQVGLAARAGYRQGQPVQAFVIAGTNTDDPTLRVGLYSVLVSSVTPFALVAFWNQCPGGTLCDATGDAVVGLGVDGPVTELTRPPFLPWVQRRDSEAARRIIREQIADTPTKVGAPIDVLQLRKDAPAAWVGRGKDSLCQPL